MVFDNMCRRLLAFFSCVLVYYVGIGLAFSPRYNAFAANVTSAEHLLEGRQAPGPDLWILPLGASIVWGEQSSTGNGYESFFLLCKVTLW